MDHWAGLPWPRRAAVGRATAGAVAAPAAPTRPCSPAVPTGAAPPACRRRRRLLRPAAALLATLAAWRLWTRQGAAFFAGDSWPADHCSSRAGHRGAAHGAVCGRELGHKALVAVSAGKDIKSSLDKGQGNEQRTGYLFICDNITERAVAQTRRFVTFPRHFKNMTEHIKPGTQLFLLNLNTMMLFGPFLPDGVPFIAPRKQSDVLSRFPAQVRVRPSDVMVQAHLDRPLRPGLLEAGAVEIVQLALQRGKPLPPKLRQLWGDAGAQAQPAQGGPLAVEGHGKKQRTGKHPGYLFICHNSTELVVARRRQFVLFEHQFKNMTEYIKPDTQLFLMNYDTLKLMGPFLPDGAPFMASPNASDVLSRFLARVRVRPSNVTAQAQLDRSWKLGPLKADAVRSLRWALKRGEPLSPDLRQLWGDAGPPSQPAQGAPQAAEAPAAASAALAQRTATGSTNDAAQAQAQGNQQHTGYLFICDNGTERVVAQTRRFAAFRSRFKNMTEHIKPNTQLFLQNSDTLKLMGPFLPDGEPFMVPLNVSDVLGRFPAQVRVRPSNIMAQAQFDKSLKVGLLEASDVEILQLALKRGEPLSPDLWQLWGGAGTPPRPAQGGPQAAEAPVPGAAPAVGYSLSQAVPPTLEDACYLFTCSISTELEVARKRLVTCPERFLPMMEEHIKPDTLIFLLNTERLKLTGPFAPDGVPFMRFGDPRCGAQLRVLPRKDTMQAQLVKEMQPGPLLGAAKAEIAAALWSVGRPLSPALAKIWRRDDTGAAVAPQVPQGVSQAPLSTPAIPPASVAASMPAEGGVAWPPRKADREEVNETRWGRLLPVPYLLQGALPAEIQGELMEVNADGTSVVRLLWEVLPPASLPAGTLRCRTQPSPLVGVVRGRWWDYMKEPRVGQPVGVRVSRKGQAQAEPGMLSLEYTPEQPLPALQTPTPAGPPGSATEWQALIRQQRMLISTESKRAPPCLPPRGWDDDQWAQSLKWIPEEMRETQGLELLPLVFTTWAIADSGQDVEVRGPFTVRERALLYALTIRRHLKAQGGSGNKKPQVLVLCGAAVEGLVKGVLSAGGVSVVRRGQGAARGQVWLGSPEEMTAASLEIPGVLSAVSMLVIDDLAYRGINRPLKELMKSLPAHKWGPSLVWMPRWRFEFERWIPALMQAPVRVRFAEQVHGAAEAFEVFNSSDVPARVVQYMHRYPRVRILIFADDAPALRARLQASDTSGRLTDNAGDMVMFRVIVADNKEQWSGTHNADVLIHASAPPGRAEYCRRLSSCLQLAVNLLAVEDGSRRLEEGWANFTDFARLTARGRGKRGLLQRLWANRQDALQEERVAQLPELLEAQEGLQLTLAEGQLNRFSDDFKSDNGSSIAWAAGLEENDMESAFANAGL